MKFRLLFRIYRLNFLCYILLCEKIERCSVQLNDRCGKGNPVVDALNNIREIGVLPVIKIEKPEYAVPLADALRKGGINAIEVTCRNESALTSINKIKEAFL